MSFKWRRIWCSCRFNQEFSIFRNSIPRCRKSNCWDSVHVRHRSIDSYPAWDPNWDKLPDSQKTGSKKFVLIRTGQYEKGRSQCSGLTIKGQRQAKLTGERLKQLYPKLESFICASSPCCMKTAEIIGAEFQKKQPDLEIKINGLIVETPLPSDPPVPSTVLHERAMFSGIPRLETVFRNLCFRPQTDDCLVYFIVSDENFIRYFICRALQFPIDHWMRFKLKHGSFSEIMVHADGSVRLRCAGEAAHLAYFPNFNSAPRSMLSLISNLIPDANHICLVKFCARHELKKFLKRNGNVVGMGSEDKKQQWDSNWDKSAPVEGQAFSNATRHILLIRHGQYQNSGDRESGRGLTKLGEAQSRETGNYLKRRQHEYTEILSSDLLWSVATSDIIANTLSTKIPRIQTSLLRECHMITPDPAHSVFLNKISRGHTFVTLPMAEAAFRNIFFRALPTQKEDSYHIVVGHLNSLCYFIARQNNNWQQPILDTITAKWDHNWDGRNITRENHAVRYIMLFNPGEFKANALTPKGLKQAFLVAERINYLHYCVGYIVHSGTVKTEQTAKAIQSRLTAGKPPILECSLMAEAEITALRSATFANDISGPHPNEALMEAAFRKHFYRPMSDHETTLEIIIACSNILSYFVCRGLQLSSDAWRRLSPPPGSITILSVARSSIVIDTFGDVGHLNLDFPYLE